MPKKRQPNSAQIVLFPSGDPVPTVDVSSSGAAGTPENQHQANRGYDVVISGSFRRDIEGLRRVHQELRDLGCIVLSPARVDPAREVQGFVYMKGEETETPERIEIQHLEAIQKATFVWLHAPDGYVGVSAALEVGFAHAQGIPVFCRNEISDSTLSSFIHRAESAAEVVDLTKNHNLPTPAPSVRAFQHYYKRVASQRGYEKENARDCLLLMVEEVGELARALRKRENLVRHGAFRAVDEASELADVFLYVIHMANILGLDLGAAVQDKEKINLAKFVSTR